MRAFKWFVVLIVVAWAGSPLTVTSRAQGPTAAFHAIGHLPGPRAASIIRDATRAGGVIHAVGGAAVRACTVTSGICGETDTAVLWRFDGTNATLEALPDIVINTTSTTPLSAYAITPDAAYIASQARTVATGVTRRAVRVTTSSRANLLLSSTLPAAAVATSIDGTILYGSTNLETIAPARGYRFDAVATTSALIPFVSPGVDTQNPVAERGSSANGNVAVGSSFSTTSNHKAYRYVLGSGVTAIPFLAGGTLNDARAVSPDGNLVLVTGNSAANPNGEAYLYTASTGAIQTLGSPNAAWSPGRRSCATGLPACSTVHYGGGMTVDGSVVAMSFSGNDGQYAYFRNTHGWFHLTSALGANGVDIAADGWNLETLQIQGMSSDGTLVFGSGEHNGNTDGFVAEFAPGVLASFNPQATPPTSTTVVGVWTFVDPGDPAPTDPDAVVVFTADGVYYHIEGEPGEPLAGFERGLYTFNGSQAALTPLFDTNGSTGLSSDAGVTFQGVTVSGDTLIVDGQVQAHRIAGSPGFILGGWVGGNPTEAHNSFVLAFAQSKYFAVYDFSDGSQSEVGTYTWDPITHELVSTVGGVSDPGNFVTLTPNGLGLHVVDDGGEAFDLARIIDPATIPAITNPQLSASGVSGQAFNYGVTATNVATFGAAGLPDGLSINSSTGQISGTPSVGGQFAVTISATSAIGVSDMETLTLTIAIPTPVGQNVVVEPVVPAGQGPVTLSFGEITAAGTTTVTIIDQSEVPAPGSARIGGVVYEVTTTATYEGLITLCFSYAGIDFGAATPRLFHYENNVWVDITTSVDPATQTICGATTTLSPFAILVSNVVRTGFYAPVNPIAGVLNSVKSGSTVPLKFNVSVNGVEQTTTAGLEMTVQMVSCDSNAPEDTVEQAAVTGGTSLRYDAGAGHFIQNWKVPKGPGCYMVRLTTTQDGLALTARFKVR